MAGLRGRRGERLRQQLRALEQRLPETPGCEVTNKLGRGDDADRPAELRAQLQDAQAYGFEVEEALASAREELDAVREISRELLADRNRSAR